MGSFKKIIMACSIATSCFVLEPIILGSTQYLSRFFSRKIEDKIDLEKTLEIEMRKLGMNKKVNATFGLYTGAKKVKRGEYFLTLLKGERVVDLRHELYHIYDNHCEDTLFIRRENLVNELKYLWIYEPQATIYSLIGLKL